MARSSRTGPLNSVSGVAIPDASAVVVRRPLSRTRFNIRPAGNGMMTPSSPPPRATSASMVSSRLG